MEHEPCPFGVARGAGRSPFVLIADHAGNRVPAVLGGLGLAPEDLQRHIALDIGVLGLGERLSAALDASLIWQQVSRLVIDCNRPLASPESVVLCSDDREIPGNSGLTPEQREQRQRLIFWPYHQTIAQALDARAERGQPSVLLALHSFTPRLGDEQRPWQIGVLYQRDSRLAQPLLDALRADTTLCVGDNQPYAVSDDSDYSIPEHGERRGLLHVGIEVRQDLLADAAGQQHWAQKLAAVLHRMEPLLLSMLDSPGNAPDVAAAHSPPDSHPDSPAVPPTALADLRPTPAGHPLP